jgi:hypothetical protein
VSVRLNHAGIAKVLRSAQMHAVIDKAAAEIAVIVRANPHIERHGAEIAVESYETDRAAAAVLIKHPAGIGIEAKHGVLADAVVASGLTLTEPKSGRR